MKYYSIGLMLFILTLVACIVLTYAVVIDLSETEDLLQQAITLQRNGDVTDAVRYMLQAQRSWEKHRNFYRSVLHHDELDLISGQFLSLSTCAEMEQFDELLCMSVDLMQQLVQLHETCIPYYFNIL